MNNRRHLTPPMGTPAASGVHATRRAMGGARRESTERVLFRKPGVEFFGWALNISRGGLRAILEDRVDLGEEFEIVVGDEDSPEGNRRKGRIVWVQEEHDGVIVGVEFVDRPPTTMPPPPDPPKEP